MALQFLIAFAQSNPTGNFVFSDTHTKSCHGVADGTIDLTVTGGSGNYTYLWSPGEATTEDLTGLIERSYTVTVHDEDTQEEASYTVTLVDPAALNLSMNIQNVSCFAGNNGAARLTVSGGEPSYSYLWSSGGTGYEIINRTAGNHSVTVTDANGCTANSSATITQPSALSLSLSSPVNANGFNVSAGLKDGSIDLTVSGGTTNYAYQWSIGAFTQDISEADPGRYSVQVTDHNQCTAIDSIILTSEDSLPPNSSPITTRGNWMNPTEDFIGSRNQAPFRFKTSNIERVRIAENGNVGIGVMNPSEQLHVAGNIKVEGDAFVNNIHISHHLTADTLLVMRITGQDSLIAFGDSTIYLDHTKNNFYARVPASFDPEQGYSNAGSQVWGIGIGANALGNGQNACAIGYACEAAQTNSIVIGSGYQNTSANKLKNTIRVR